MTRLFLFISMYVITFSATDVQAATPMRVDLFVDAPLILPANSNVHLWDLSLPEKTKARYLPHPLSADPQIARQQMMRFMASQEGETFKQAMRDAYQGFAVMTKLKVQKIPAIVIDQHFVVYGTTDIEQALLDYAHYIAEQR